MQNNPINLDAFPLDRPHTGEYRQLVADAARTLSELGVLSLESFLTGEGTARLAGVVRELLPQAHRSVRQDTAYGIPPSDDMPADHPYRILGRTDRYGVAYHQMHATELGELYRWPPLRQFVADVTGHGQLYLHEDPCNALVVQVYKSGGGLAWHFDQALFSTILNLGESESGGAFECVPHLRSAENPCFAEVREVLLGHSDRVRRFQAGAGSFTIIYGRYTLHRVATIKGASPRLSLVLSYEDRPGVRMDPATRRKLFGPTAPAD